MAEKVTSKAEAKKVTKPEKHTEEFALSELADMLARVKADNDILFIGELFFDRDYPRQVYSVWKQKFSNVKQITDTINMIEELLEARVAKGALKNELNPRMSQFLLSCKYNWKEKSEVDVGNKEGGEPFVLKIKGYTE